MDKFTKRATMAQNVPRRATTTAVTELRFKRLNASGSATASNFGQIIV